MFDQTAILQLPGINDIQALRVISPMLLLQSRMGMKGNELTVHIDLFYILTELRGCLYKIFDRFDHTLNPVGNIAIVLPVRTTGVSAQNLLKIVIVHKQPNKFKDCLGITLSLIASVWPA
ncbi:MAG: hypothetical protein AB2688_05225 [Candidatus Thiodiazotropha taylori]